MATGEATKGLVKRRLSKQDRDEPPSERAQTLSSLSFSSVVEAPTEKQTHRSQNRVASPMANLCSDGGTASAAAAVAGSCRRH